MMKGKGASKMSIMVMGSIGIRVCFHWKGKMNDMKQLITWDSKALCFETNKTLRSSKMAEKTSRMLSMSRHLSRFSMSSLFAKGGCWSVGLKKLIVSPPISY